ncbi:MAG: hypothetical protein AAB776_02970 [Patescibacteria group bacterium]
MSDVWSSRFAARLEQFGLTGHPLLTRVLTAYVIVPSNAVFDYKLGKYLPVKAGRVELGQHLLADLCRNPLAIMRQHGYKPGQTCGIMGVMHGNVEIRPFRLEEVTPTAIALELDGQYLGYVREDGVFYAATPDADEFVAWFQATDMGHFRNEQDPPPATRTHRGLELAVSSHELAVIAHGGYLERKFRAQQSATADIESPTLTTPIQQEIYA